MTGMIPEDHLTVGAIARFLGVSERRVREVIERGEMAAVRVGQRAWAIPPEAAVAWANVHPQRGRRLTNDAQWALIAELAGGDTDWFTPLLRHRTRERIKQWTPHKISDAVSQRGPMPEAVRGTWRRQPDLRAFEHAEHSDPDVHRRGLDWIASLQALWHQRQRYRWWMDRGIEFEDFWAATDPPADGVVPVVVPDGAVRFYDGGHLLLRKWSRPV